MLGCGILYEKYTCRHEERRQTIGKKDISLKNLAINFIIELATWLLKIKIVQALPLPTNLFPSFEEIRTDNMFEVMTDKNQTGVLHLEFQGPGSHSPMPDRELNYLSRLRLTKRYRQAIIQSVVIYLGDVGKNDPGFHQVLDFNGNPTLTWRYTVIRLKDIDAEDLIATGQPAVMALIGMSRMKDPEQAFKHCIAPYCQAQRQRAATSFAYGYDTVDR